MVTKRPVGRLYVLEGLSAVGKSVTLEAIGNLLVDAIVVPTIAADYQPAREVFDRNQNVLARHLFYLAALAATATTISENLSAGRVVLTESYLARTQTFHRAMGSALVHNLQILFPQPSLTFILTCDEGTRAKRIRRRGRAIGYWHQLAEHKRAHIVAEYERLEGITHYVDSNGTVSATAREIERLIQEDMR